MGPGPVREEPATIRPKNPPSRPWYRSRWLFGVVTLGLALGLWLARSPILAGAGRFLDVSEEPVRSDIVLVLGGDHDYRPAVAAALYKAGLTSRILIPVTVKSPEVEAGLTPPEDDVTAKVLQARGVPAEAIVRLPGRVDSTADETKALARFLAEHPARVVTVVTTDFHTRRARMLFRRADLGGASLHFVAAPARGFGADDWWRTDGGCATYLTEFVKLAYQSLGF